MSVNSEEERPPNLLLFAVIADRLRDCQNVPFIECAVEGRPAMAGRTEHDALSFLIRIGPQRVVSGHKFRNVYQDRGVSRLSGGRIHLH